jgi:hypothetical protein
MGPKYTYFTKGDNSSHYFASLHIDSVALTQQVVNRTEIHPATAGLSDFGRVLGTFEVAERLRGRHCNP